jgi:hypothetical protein
MGELFGFVPVNEFMFPLPPELKPIAEFVFVQL